MKAFLPLIVLFMATDLQAATRVFDGHFDSRWSREINWSPPGRPRDGEDLIFPAGSPNSTITNDIVDLRVRTLTFDSAYYVVGNALTISNGITCSQEDGNVVIECGLALGADQLFSNPDDDLLLTGELQLNGFTLQLRPGVSFQPNPPTAYVFGSVSGAGNLENISGAPVVIGGPTGNTFTGTLRTYGPLYLDKDAGAAVVNRLEAYDWVRLSNGHQIGDSATVFIGPIGRLLFQGFDDDFSHLVLEGGGGFSQSGLDTQGGLFGLLGSLVVNATNESARIAGRVRLASASHSFSINGPHTPALDFDANISGPGGFSKGGEALMRLRGTNSHTGACVVTAGVVEAQHATAFGSTAGGVVLSGSGAVVLRGVAIGNEPLTVNGTAYQFTDTYGSLLFGYDNSSWAGPITLNTNLVVYSGDTTTFSGAISGPGGLDIFYDTVRLSGSSGNTFSGTTRVLAGTLELQKSTGDAIAGPLEIGDAIGGPGADVVRLLTGTVIGSGTINVRRSGLLDLNGYSDGIGALTLNGGSVVTGTGTLTLGGDLTSVGSPRTATIEGNLSLGGVTRTFTVSDGSSDPDLSIAAIISNGGFEKRSGGTLYLSGANTHAGATVVWDGILLADSDSALGNTAGDTTIVDGATLWLGANVSNLPEPLWLNGAGVGGSSAALIGVLAVTASGNIVLNTTATIEAQSGSQFHLSGVISGPGALTKTGAGSLFLSGSSANTYSGGTFANDGVLYLNKPDNVASIPGGLVIGTGFPGSAAIVSHLFGNNTIGGTITVNRSSLLNLNGHSENFPTPPAPPFRGPVQLQLNEGGSVQTGAGVLSLPPNSRVGVNPGASSGSTISGRIAMSGSGTGNHDFEIDSAVVPGGPALTLSATISTLSGAGTAHLSKTGPGELRLEGNNSFNGMLTVDQGLLTLAGSTARGTSGQGVLVTRFGALTIDGNVTIGGENLTLDSTAATALTVLNGSTFWNGPVLLNRNSTINTGPGAALEITGAISGSGFLTKTGPGQLYLSGSVANTYTNTTWVKEGDLLLNKTASNGAVPGPLIVGDGVGTANSDIVYISRVRQIGNTVPVTIHASGLLDIVAGTSDAFGALHGSGNILFEGNNDLEVGLDNGSSTFSGLISGGGDFWKHGTGTLILSGDNTYTGLTIVEGGGTLLVNGSQPSSAVIVSNVGTLGGSGRVGSITANNGIIAPGASTGILTCGNLTMDASDIFSVELNGNTPGSGHDQLNVLGTVSLGGAGLNVTASPFTPVVGQPLVIINNDGSDAVSGTFGGLANGGHLAINGFLFRLNYNGGSGNDVTLTLTNPPLNLAATALVTGNGNGVADPNECNLLYVALTNTTPSAASGIQATLTSDTPGVIVTQPFASYPDGPAASRRTIHSHSKLASRPISSAARPWR